MGILARLAWDAAANVAVAAYDAAEALRERVTWTPELEALRCENRRLRTRVADLELLDRAMRKARERRVVS